MRDLLQQDVDVLNPVLIDIRKEDFPAAEQDLAKAVTAIAGSNAAFQEFGYLYADNARYRRLYEAASGVRQIQHQLVGLIEDLLKQHRTAGVAGLANLRDKFESVRGAYNEKQKEFAECLGQLQSVTARP